MYRSFFLSSTPNSNPFQLTIEYIVVVKNTGHDFTGRSSGQGGFALWTHLLTSKSHNKNFVPKGCKWAPQDSVTLEAGVQWGKAYDFAEKEGITLVGGACPQVGSAGGWILVRYVIYIFKVFSSLISSVRSIGWWSFHAFSFFRAWRRQSSRGQHRYTRRQASNGQRVLEP